MLLDNITQPFIKEFKGDYSMNPMQRQTVGMLYSIVEPSHMPDATLLEFNREFSLEVGLGNLVENKNDEAFLNAQFIPSHLKPYATAYAGHQFGNWAGQLGDGRAIFAGEISSQGMPSYELQWKGAGATPYSRHADGRAVLRSTVREYLISEAMHHLGVPTTRSLSISLTGENVLRDKRYSGDAKYESGALMMRAAESFLRFGHFELVSAWGDVHLLEKLVQYSARRYFPELNHLSGEELYLEWFREIQRRSINLVCEWYRVGLVHGVLNTDNMSILGLGIDYGPFSMLDEYDLSFTPNTTDLPGRRYAFGEQGRIFQWNLLQLANAISPLFSSVESVEEVINDFPEQFWSSHDEMLRRKFGFEEALENDTVFFRKWQKIMQDFKLDYSLFFEILESIPENEINSQLFRDAMYQEPDLPQVDVLNTFLKEYWARKSKNKISDQDSKIMMIKANPKFILRNYLLFECIEALEKGDRTLFNQLSTAIKTPYSLERSVSNVRRPSGYEGVFGCSQLSCSS